MNNIKGFILASLLLFSIICAAQISDKPVLIRQDFKSTSGSSVTITTYKKDGVSYIYHGGQSNLIDVYSMNEKGKLTPISTHKLSNDKGPARGLIADNINGTDYLFAGNKGASRIEVFQIQDDGSLDSVFVLDDTDKTYLGTIITLQVVHMEQASYLFVGGLEETPGLSCFKIMDNGSLIHVQSLKDNDKIHTDGIIGMVSHKINGKTFLYTGGFHDSGVSSFRVFGNGKFKNINNISDNKTDRYLTGTYPVTGVTLGDNHYVVVGHRHYKYYKRAGSFIKTKDWEYHGDAVSVFKVNNSGELVPHFTLIDDESTMISGQTRIEILTVNEKEAIVAVATKDDASIQLCKMDETGVLQPLSYIKTGYPIYYGLSALKINKTQFFIGGSTNFDTKKIVSYKVSPESPDFTGKVIRHVVSLKFKANITQEDIDKTMASLENLKNEIPEIADFEWGPNDSTEGLSKGFGYSLIFTFNDVHAREIYLFHKKHLELVDQVFPLLEDIMVMDYWTDISAPMRSNSEGK